MSTKYYKYVLTSTCDLFVTSSATVFEAAIWLKP